MAGLDLLSLFIQHIDARTDLCKEDRVNTFWIPAHASHFLKPLCVGCFAALKRAYREIGVLANYRIKNIDKKAFLDDYKKENKGGFSSSNIRFSFRAIVSVLDNSEVVLSKFDMKLCTPTPPALETTPWKTNSPRSTLEIGAHNIIHLDKIRALASFSSVSVVEIVK